VFPYGVAPPLPPPQQPHTDTSAGILPGGMPAPWLYEQQQQQPRPPPSRARSPSPPVLPTGAMRRMMHVQDLRPGVFCDIVVELVSMRTDARNVAAIVTDYTAPFTDTGGGGGGGGGGGNGEAAGRGLLVTFWDQHADSVRPLAPGAYLHLINLKVKRNRYSELEGALHSGAYSKLAVLPASHPLVLPLLTRKGGPAAVRAAAAAAADENDTPESCFQPDIKRARGAAAPKPALVPAPLPVPLPVPAPAPAPAVVPTSPVRPGARLSVHPVCTGAGLTRTERCVSGVSGGASFGGAMLAGRHRGRHCRTSTGRC
jgi:hypothetical protein